MFAPEQPLPAGQEYILRYGLDSAIPGEPESCNENLTELRFATSEPVAVELSSPDLRLLSQGFADYFGRQVSQVVFEYVEPSAAAKPLRDVSATLDGQELWADPLLDKVAFAVRSYCDGTGVTHSTCGDVTSVEPGRHELVIKTAIVGQPAQRELRAIVDTTCEGAGARVLEQTESLETVPVTTPGVTLSPAVMPDAGMADAAVTPAADDTLAAAADAGGDAGAPPGSSTTGKPARASTETGEDGGCSTGQGLPASASLFVLLALLLRRRREQQRAA